MWYAATDSKERTRRESTAFWTLIGTDGLLAKLKVTAISTSEMEGTDQSISNGLLRHGLNVGFFSNACLLFALLETCVCTFAMPCLFAEAISFALVAGRKGSILRDGDVGVKTKLGWL